MSPRPMRRPTHPASEDLTRLGSADLNIACRRTDLSGLVTGQPLSDEPCDTQEGRAAGDERPSNAGQDKDAGDEQAQRGHGRRNKEDQACIHG
ncbi:hypothetical protein EMIT0194P_160133 [Pseudomonas serbica]